ncbi:hypothetical protein [Leptospira ilyithenensis]|uniref:Uncharacterized protein n=1 Tax=Leptospira ilyithenensis TaxID=2484901 RepID=A0A4R9LQ77_9LEPT|nr:hypothetical protein [Leptospira ilyithenensis]TGN09775.1 hypothetical protein EHS11_11880 [Leptospira ilyithenensis]
MSLYNNLTPKRKLSEFCEAQGCESFGDQIIDGNLLCQDHVTEAYAMITQKAYNDKYVYI